MHVQFYERSLVEVRRRIPDSGFCWPSDMIQVTDLAHPLGGHKQHNVTGAIALDMKLRIPTP